MILKFHCSSLLFQCSSVPTFIILLLLLLFLRQQKLFKVVFKPISRESWTLQERFLRYAKILWQKLFSNLGQFQIWFLKKIPSKSSHPYHEYLPVNFFPCILIVLVNKSGFRDTLKFRWQKLYKWETLAHAVIPLLNQIKICTLWCE